MRKPIQVLIIPYIKNADESVNYVIFKREDMNVWQGIAGGFEEEDGDVLTAAKREAYEEANIPKDANFIQLDASCSIPVNFIYGNYFWGEDIYQATEYSFAVDVTNINISISDEHKEYRIVDYDTAFKMLKWDSNRNALWEINERIKKENNKVKRY